MKTYGSSRTRNPIHDEFEEDNDFDEEEEEEEEEENPDHKSSAAADHFYNNNNNTNYEDSSKRHPKKRKLLESFVSNNPPPPPPRRDTWSEEESFVLLEVWGERYMELGRRSLRADDWAEVTEKVLEMSGGVERAEEDCRHQMDVMKNKYKKERAKVEASGTGSKWVFFKKMDVLLNMRTRGHCGLGCGVDSGEFVFMNPRVYLDRSNVLDEMRDSPGQSDQDNEDDDNNEEDGFNNRGGKEEEEEEEEEEEDGESARLLAESIQRFGEIYEKIEDSKRKQMLELEKIRQDFQKELELQKKHIVDTAQAEISKIREMDDNDDGDYDDDDDSTDTSAEENLGD